MRLLDAARGARRALVENVGRLAGRVQETRPVDVDVYEGETAFLIVFDAPGASGEDVQVRFADGVVEVRVDRFRGFHEAFEMVFPGRGLTLEGRAELPAGAAVDPHGAEATLRQTGVLEVTLPKAEGRSTAGDAADEPADDG